MKLFAIGLLICCTLLASCSLFPLTETGSNLESTPTATATLQPTAESTQPAPGPTVLTIWLPPQFDPENGTQASDLLQSRLDEYTAQRSDVRIETRIKAASGSGGLLDSLSTANAAAPLLVPDLILLPRESVEIAALKGLLFPFDEYSNALDDDDWYPYAQDLAHLQASIYGIPFAGNALISLYRPAEIEVPPEDWTSTLELAQPMAFPAADEQALFTLTQYLSAGGLIQNAEGRPTLEPSRLIEVLSFYEQAEGAGVMPFWLTQFTTDEQSWESYAENQVNLIASWTNRYLTTLPGDTAAASILTEDGIPLTIANGWAWALSSPQLERQALSVDLAEFLTQGEFLAAWTEAGGYLPPRASALEGWSNAALRSLMEQVIQSARIIPPNDVMAALGPALQEAVVNVLKQQSDPATAASQAIDSLENP
jgi:multiple sugar transport system substrate-binding protein